jgi:NitT/TauT family transport system permease protein
MSSLAPAEMLDSVAPVARRGVGVRGTYESLVRAWPALLTGAVIIAIWELVVRVREIPRYLLPAPSVIFGFFISNLDLIWLNAFATGKVVLYGFLLSAAVGVPLGIAIVEWRPFARTIYPLLVATQTFPKLAIAPLFVVWFGFGLAPKLLMVFLVAFFPIIIDTSVGLRSVRSETLLLARSMGMGYFRTFFQVRIPQGLPSLFGGLKIGVTLAVVGAVVAEFLGAQAGLGHLIIVSTGVVNTPLLFSALLGLVLLGLAFYLAINAVESVAIRWRTEEVSQFNRGTL